MQTDQRALKNQKQAGVLLHISSLPSAGYIGDLGQDAKQMVDRLADMQVRVWQTLPINMPHEDRSPYQCISAFAGNTEFISLETLAAQELLQTAQIDAFYASGLQNKQTLLSLAYHQFIAEHDQTSFTAFCQKEAFWLDDYALFLALRAEFQQQSWHTWPAVYKDRDEVVIQAARLKYAAPIAEIQFSQFIFFSQWQSLKTYANSKNVQLFGDIPIFVAYDSAEVWAKPHLFKLDDEKNMTVVAGVPPDYFSATGQRWGNPHYAWHKMAVDNFVWWVARLAKQNELFDLIRIDHFRGLEAAWEIDVNEVTAINGEWILAPGDALLAAIYQQLPNIHLVAEDLGIITAEVDALRLKYQLPGMKILQFAFGGDDANPYLPHNIEENSVAYTGTHDNDTSLGWYNTIEPHVKAHFHQYLNNDSPQMPQALIHMALATPAYLTIIPLQDILCLGTEARMNIPGTVVNNWVWRFDWPALTEEKMTAFKEAIINAGRDVLGDAF